MTEITYHGELAQQLTADIQNHNNQLTQEATFNVCGDISYTNIGDITKAITSYESLTSTTAAVHDALTETIGQVNAMTDSFADLDAQQAQAMEECSP